MDALIERQTGYILAAAQKAAEDTDASVEERIAGAILALRVEQTDMADKKTEMIEHLHKPQNVLMHQKTRQILLRRVPPILADIIKDGISQGLFETPCPLECMEIAFSYLAFLLDDDAFGLTREQQAAKLRAFIFYLERMLGVGSGQLSFMRRLFLGGEKADE